MEKGEGKPKISLDIIRMVLLWIFIPSLIVIAVVLTLSAIIFGFEEDGRFATSSLMFFKMAGPANQLWSHLCMHWHNSHYFRHRCVLWPSTILSMS
jgi:hypothetical protein